MAKAIVKVIFLFVSPAAGEDGLKTVGSVSCKLETNIQSPLEVKSSLKGSLQESVGSFRSALQGPLWPLSAARNMQLEKKQGAFTCTLSQSAGGKPIGTISGGKKFGGTNVKGTLSSPAEWPMKPSAFVSAQRDIGPMSCTLKSATLPFKEKMTELEVRNLGTVTLAQKVKEFDCTLTGTITEKGGKVLVGSGKASAKTKMDTPIGPVCGVLETPIDTPTKAVGTVSWKKTLGSVCCNLKATSKGAFTCTFDTGAEFVSKKAVESEAGFDGSTTIPIVALIGFAVGGIITFAMFRPGRWTLTAGEQHLLA